MKTDKLLGDIECLKKTFPDIDKAFQEFKKKEFCELIDRKRSEKVNRTLLNLIQKEPEPCFLLSAVLEFVGRVCQEEILDHYTFTSFELWLNQYSGLRFEENYRIRAKIAGKLVDRSDYELFFPIGAGKVFEGTHFVTAHKSPDLDTTVASFWGWLDAFAARVGDGLHVWNVPGGPPLQVEIDWIFKDLFGSCIFTHLAKTRASLNLIGNDLMTQKGMLRKHLSDSITSIDHDRDRNAVVIVDKNGFYLGDWRSADVEGVQEVVLLLSSCLRWFENSVHLHLMSLFKKESLHEREITPYLNALFQLKLSDCEPGQEFTQKQKQKVCDFLIEVVGIQKGLDCTFEELVTQLGEFMGAKTPISFESAQQLVLAMKSRGLFDASGKLLEDRSRIFTYLEETVRSLHEAIFAIRGRLETLDVAMKTKVEVFKHNPTIITVRSDIEEMRSKIRSHSFLTVNYPDGEHLFPVGVVHAATLRKNILGTVSLRDFCNRDEMGIPSYLEIISVIDHHKSVLSTSSAVFAIIADAQSSNTLVAKQSFLLNDRHSLLGQSLEGIEKQLSETMVESSPLATRVMQNLLQRRMIAKNKTKFFIHPEREYIEYLHFLYAIIDDTDLLTKVTSADVECVTELLNRMKSIVSGRICEIVSLDDLPRNRNFVKKAAQRILQNKEMYSLYRKVYELREKEIEHNLKLASEGKPSNLFADTKEQNGRSRIGQTKVFKANIATLRKKAPAIRQIWLKMAEESYRENPDIALHLHMISTIVSADEVYSGSQEKYSHKDELWIWIPSDDEAIELLKRFLRAFQSSPGLKNMPLEVEFLGKRVEELSQIFKESFSEVTEKISDENLPVAILRFNPGALNSRKALVTPFLPT